MFERSTPRQPCGAEMMRRAVHRDWIICGDEEVIGEEIADRFSFGRPWCPGKSKESVDLGGGGLRIPPNMTRRVDLTDSVDMLEHGFSVRYSNKLEQFLPDTRGSRVD